MEYSNSKIVFYISILKYILIDMIKNIFVSEILDFILFTCMTPIHGFLHFSTFFKKKNQFFYKKI